jgi:phosphate transport system permease protein
MSEINSANKLSSVLEKSTSSRYQRWRLTKDTMARFGVIAGGLSVIVALVLIFFYLLYVVIPLFKSASAEIVNHYAVPETTRGKTVLLDVEEQNEVAVRLTDTGQVVFFEAATGKMLATKTVKIPEGVKIVSFAQASPLSDGVFAYGLSNGKIVVAKYQYQVSYINNKRQITPSLFYPLGEEALVMDEQGAAIEKIALVLDDKTSTLVAKTADKIRLLHIEKEQNIMTDEITLNRTQAVLEAPAAIVATIHLDKEQRNLYLLGTDGHLSFFDIGNKNAPILRQNLDIVVAGATITASQFLNGDSSLLVGDSNGLVSQWTMVRDELKRPAMKNIRAFKVSDKTIVTINAEPRRKGFVAMDADGLMGVYYTTSEREVLKESLFKALPVRSAIAPRANGLLVEANDANVYFWKLDNKHPEVSIKSLWQEVWYEGYGKPDYVWQSSAANNDFEPKYSLTPLVFGTLKAAFYAMLVAVPLSLMGAIYSAYFMTPAMRQLVKPTIELMGALPTVILGFLAGLWLAPTLEENLSGFFLMFLLLPIGVLLFAYGWGVLPKRWLEKIPEGWEAVILIPVILIIGWLAFTISVPLESALFGSTLREWLKNVCGIGYDQRNALVVGIAMGFAVIPTIFSIADDAIFSVPKHLTVGSLALGATLWQTMVRVVLLTASPGIFSAVMIGLGRAVGETMIVLMATGNTPVMDFSIFQGLRTLAANIAVEMPESQVDSSHYRVLFLAALVLFLFTFVFNTLAEIIRQRLREKYSSL